MIIKWDTPAGQIEAIEFDATPREVMGRDALVTEHPVEEGVPSSTSARPGPFRVVATAWVTNKPTRSIGRHVATPGSIAIPQYTRVKTGDLGVQGGPGFVVPLPGLRNLPIGGSPVTVTPATYADKRSESAMTVLTFATPFDRVREAMDALDQLVLDSQRVTVITALKEYPNMYVEAWTAPKTPAKALEFTITFKQVRVANAETIDVPQPAEPRGQKSKSKGPAAGYTLTEQTQSSADALLGSVLD